MINMNLGYWIGRFAYLEASEVISHDDVAMWSAPGECHGDVTRGYIADYKKLRQELKNATGLHYVEMVEMVVEAGMNFYRIYEMAVGRIYHKYNPFN